MCYASPVMLRGRYSYAISERPTPSLFVSPSLLPPLTPFFPLDASHSPVSPLFPLDTQNRGVYPPSNMINRFILQLSPARSSAVPFCSVLSLRSSANSALLRYLFPFPFPCSSLATKSNHSRTYDPPSRKSNHSRTYEKQGVGRLL